MQDSVPDVRTNHNAGYVRGKGSDYNAEFAIDEAKFWEFLGATQAAELAKLHYKPLRRSVCSTRLSRTGRFLRASMR